MKKITTMTQTDYRINRVIALMKRDWRWWDNEQEARDLAYSVCNDRPNADDKETTRLVFRRVGLA